MSKNYTLQNKPQFSQGDKVKVDLRALGSSDDQKYAEGTICGKVSDFIIDHWIVDFGKPFHEVIKDQSWTYPYHCVSIQHTFIKDETSDCIDCISEKTVREYISNSMELPEGYRWIKNSEIMTEKSKFWDNNHKKWDNGCFIIGEGWDNHFFPVIVPVE